MRRPDDHSWVFGDSLDDDTLAVLGTVPGRWGRMTPLSRLLIVETGRLLREHHLLPEVGRCFEGGIRAGLIGGCRRGSLQTDLDFFESMRLGVGFASPALFGYTLPNTPLAEAAGHFGLVGPVYALLDDEKPYEMAVGEAEQLLQAMPELAFIVAGSFDLLPAEKKGLQPKLVAQLTVIER